MTLEARFAGAVRGIGGPVVVACSGGGDSMALLHLSVRAFGPQQVTALTVDHGLRAEAAAEIALVASQCQRLGVAHLVRRWSWEGRGNLQAAARAARHAFFRAEGRPVLLGHTADDQAETVLLRLARGSGVDGLAGMAQAAPPLFRPLLGENRADLRAWLRAQGIPWADDPSNDDPRFDRVRARKLAATLADLGLTRDRLVHTATLMAEERVVLRQAALAWAKAHVTETQGDLRIPLAALRAAPVALTGRVLAAALAWFSGRIYKPRRAALRAWQAAIQQGQTAPLAGVLARAEGAHLRLTREAAAAPQAAPLRPGTLWDHRWQIAAPPQTPPGLSIAPLGPDIAQCPDWRATGLPRHSLRASPAIRAEQTLIAAPLAGMANGWDARIAIPFLQTLESD